MIDERFSSLRKIVSSTFDNIFKLNAFLFQLVINILQTSVGKKPLASVLEHVQLKNAADNDDSCCTGLRRKEILQAGAQKGGNATKFFCLLQNVLWKQKSKS